MTIKSLLPGSFLRMDEALKTDMQKQSAGSQLPGFVWHMAGSEATTAITDALNMDVFSLLAWRREIAPSPRN